MRLNASEIKDLDTCPQLHHYKWIDRRVRVEPIGEALALGKAAHRVAELWLKENRATKVADHLDIAISSPAKLEALEIAMVAWILSEKPWDGVFAVEKVLEREHDGVTLFGMLDMGVSRWGKFWIVEHKTLDGRKSVPVFTQSVRTSLQAGLYAFLAEPLAESLGLAFGGIMLNVIRKLSLKSATADPHSALHVEFLSIPPELVEATLLDVKDAATRRGALSARPYRNRESCKSVYGNSLCPYYGVCWGNDQLSDPVLFETRDPLEHYEAR